jgi:hypothetical protein
MLTTFHIELYIVSIIKEWLELNKTYTSMVVFSHNNMNN